MVTFRTYKSQVAAKKAANGMPFLRVAGVYVVAKTSTGQAFRKDKLIVLYSPSGRVVKSVNMLTTKGTARREREQRVELVRRLLLKRSGTTRAEVLRRTGWASVSMQAEARNAGLELRTEGSNPIRYFGVRRSRM